MADIRIHHYTVDPADTEEWLARRAAVISAIRAAHPGLIEARLIRLDDGTYIDASQRIGVRTAMSGSRARSRLGTGSLISTALEGQ